RTAVAAKPNRKGTLVPSIRSQVVHQPLVHKVRRPPGCSRPPKGPVRPYERILRVSLRELRRIRTGACFEDARLKGRAAGDIRKSAWRLVDKDWAKVAQTF